VRLTSPIGSAAGGSVNLSNSLSNVAKLAAHPKLCGFSTPIAMGQSFIMTLYMVNKNTCNLTLTECLYQNINKSYLKKKLRVNLERMRSG
jgi:hypothetical protein